MKFELTILGCNSAVPTFDRFTTAQVLQVGHQIYLIDCGEGTQVRLGQFGISKSKINQIFISHLHGDHIFGLIGLLTSFSLRGREKPIDIFSPKGLQEMIEVQIKNSESHLSYPLNFHEVDTTVSKLVFEDNLIEVYTIPLIHRVPTSGYLFREKQAPLNIRSEKITELNIPVEQIIKIKKGADFVMPDGTKVPHKDLVLAPMQPRSYAFCSDTVYNETIIPIINRVDLLYHETTFLHEKLEKAVYTKHTTALQAGMIAKAAEAGQLVTGHYSSRYDDVSPLIEEAKTVFPNTIAGSDGEKYEVLQKRSPEL